MIGTANNILTGSEALPLFSGQRSAVSGQRSAVSGQRSAVSGQRSAVSGQRSAVSGQRSAVSGQRSAVSGQRSAVSGQRSAVSGQRSAVSGQRSAVSGQRQRSAVSGQRSAVSGQRSAVSGQRSAVSGQRSAVSGQRSAKQYFLFPSHGVPMLASGASWCAGISDNRLAAAIGSEPCGNSFCIAASSARPGSNRRSRFGQRFSLIHRFADLWGSELRAFTGNFVRRGKAAGCSGLGALMVVPERHHIPRVGTSAERDTNASCAHTLLGVRREAVLLFAAPSSTLNSQTSQNGEI